MSAPRESQSMLTLNNLTRIAGAANQRAYYQGTTLKHQSSPRNRKSPQSICDVKITGRPSSQNGENRNDYDDQEPESERGSSLAGPSQPRSVLLRVLEPGFGSVCLRILSGLLPRRNYDTATRPVYERKLRSHHTCSSRSVYFSRLVE